MLLHVPSTRNIDTPSYDTTQPLFVSNLYHESACWGFYTTLDVDYGIQSSNANYRQQHRPSYIFCQVQVLSRQYGRFLGIRIALQDIPFESDAIPGFKTLCQIDNESSCRTEAFSEDVNKRACQRDHPFGPVPPTLVLFPDERVHDYASVLPLAALWRIIITPLDTRLTSMLHMLATSITSTS